MSGLPLARKKNRVTNDQSKSRCRKRSSGANTNLHLLFLPCASIWSLEYQKVFSMPVLIIFISFTSPPISTSREESVSHFPGSSLLSGNPFFFLSSFLNICFFLFSYIFFSYQSTLISSYVTCHLAFSPTFICLFFLLGKVTLSFNHLCSFKSAGQIRGKNVFHYPCLNFVQYMNAIWLTLISW